MFGLQDDPLLDGYNVQQRITDFINAAISQVISVSGRDWSSEITYESSVLSFTNHVMWTMGDDFHYQYAESSFKQIDKLIHYVNKVVLDEVIVVLWL